MIDFGNAGKVFFGILCFIACACGLSDLKNQADTLLMKIVMAVLLLLMLGLLVYVFIHIPDAINVYI